MQLNNCILMCMMKFLLFSRLASSSNDTLEFLGDAKGDLIGCKARAIVYWPLMVINFCGKKDHGKHISLFTNTPDKLKTIIGDKSKKELISLFCVFLIGVIVGDGFVLGCPLVMSRSGKKSKLYLIPLHLT
jgi:hypothetical protein